MTPSQMLRPKPPRDTEALYTPLIVPGTSQAALKLIFDSESDHLAAGRCPMCRNPVDVEIDKKDGMIYYRCISNPVFHEWRRTQSFLARD